MDRFVRLAQLIGLNSIPLAGVFWRNWSDGTAIAFYWCETVLVLLFVFLRTIIHRRISGNTRGYPFGYFLMAIAFGTANLVFLAVILGLFPQNVGAGEIDFHAMGQGLLLSLGFLAVGFLVDLPGLAQRPVKWIERMAEGAFGRVAIITVAIFIGLFLAVVLGIGRALFWVFFGLKLLADIEAQFGRFRPRTE